MLVGNEDVLALDISVDEFALLVEESDGQCRLKELLKGITNECSEQAS